EFGSTAAMFPIDDVTCDYLRLTGRSDAQVALVEAYAKAQGLWHDPASEPVFSEYLELDLATVVPSIAGPKRPQDRVILADAVPMFRKALQAYVSEDDSDQEPDEALLETFPASDPASTNHGHVDHEPAAATAARVKDRASNPTRVSMDGQEFEIDHGHVAIAAIT